MSGSPRANLATRALVSEEMTQIRAQALFSRHLHVAAQTGWVSPTELLSRKKRDHPGALRPPRGRQRISRDQRSPQNDAQKSYRREPTWFSAGGDLRPESLPAGSAGVLRLEWCPCRVPPGTSIHTRCEAYDHETLIIINSLEGTRCPHLKNTGPFIGLLV